MRHGLNHRQVAAVLSLDPLAARELLATAHCEVERTRAALAVVETGSCPTVARLTGDHRCSSRPPCAPNSSGTSTTAPAAAAPPSAWALRALARRRLPAPDRLPLVEAPRAAAYMAMLHVPRARAGALRFAPTGFPLDPKDHTARRDRMRARAVTTTVVAAVVAAPVLALWTTYRGTTETTAHDGDGSARARRTTRPARTGTRTTGTRTRATPAPPPSPASPGQPLPDVSVEVVSPGGPTGSGAPRSPANPPPAGSRSPRAATAT